MRIYGGSTLALSRFRDRTDAESNEGPSCPRKLSHLGILGLPENKVLRSSYRPVLTSRVLGLSMFIDPLFASLTLLPRDASATASSPWRICHGVIARLRNARQPVGARYAVAP
jgi:hypothetical protein